MAYYGDLDDILRRARQKYSYGQGYSIPALKAATAGAIEAKGARTLEYAKLGQAKKAQEAQDTYQYSALGQQSSQFGRSLELQKRAQKAEALGGYLQLGLGAGYLGLGTEGGRKLLGLSGAGTTPASTLPHETTYAGGYTPTGVGAAPALTEAGAAGTYGGFTPTSSFANYGAFTPTSAAGAGAAGAGGVAASTLPHELAFAEGSAATAGTGAGMGLVGAGSGLFGGMVGQKLTKAGEEGHEGGEVWTGRAVGAVVGAGASAGIGALMGAPAGPLGIILGGVIGGFVGGGGGK